MNRKPRIRPRKNIKADPTVTFNYKQPELLKKYMTEQGEILPRTESNLTAKQQRELATAVKRARHLALVPYTQVVF